MDAQGEKTVYGNRRQLGKFCLFDRGLVVTYGAGAGAGFTSLNAMA
jgi:hypothetical protein